MSKTPPERVNTLSGIAFGIIEVNHDYSPVQVELL